MNWKNAFTITLTGNYDPLYLNRVDFIFFSFANRAIC